MTLGSKLRALASARIVVRTSACILLLLLVKAYFLSFWSPPTYGIQDAFDDDVKTPNLGDGATYTSQEQAHAKTLVVSSVRRENTTWLHQHFPDWHKAIYVVDDPSASLTVVRNKGRESGAYLTYIIDNYHNLPETMVFLHAERYQWHNEDPMYDGVPPIENLRISHVQTEGYANLRCTWSLGCPAALHPFSLITKVEATFEPWNDRANTEASYAKAFRELFPSATETPPAVGVPCGAQFALSRAAVLARPRSEWQRVRRWLWQTTLPDSVSGRIMEYAWHILANKPAEHCPDARSCFCERFGLCDLDCRSPGSCEGRYRLPKHEEIPEGWPAVGPGTNGFPEAGWWES